MHPTVLVIACFDTEFGSMALAANPAGVLARIWFDYPHESDLRSAIKATIDAWHAQTLLLTHFGPANQPASHIAELRDRLHELKQQLFGVALPVDP